LLLQLKKILFLMKEWYRYRYRFKNYPLSCCWFWAGPPQSPQTWTTAPLERLAPVQRKILRCSTWKKSCCYIVMNTKYLEILVLLEHHNNPNLLTLTGTLSDFFSRKKLQCCGAGVALFPWSRSRQN